ncbi:hypothetical protein [Candidatus Sororendozoicomonas aggregata]|uniref:hypothetical protein n=1 Tax=Candidatus Sororendozoicomonas aggregata TaxID=3073239 RepID=UPI002ED3984C
MEHWIGGYFTYSNLHDQQRYNSAHGVEVLVCCFGLRHEEDHLLSFEYSLPAGYDGIVDGAKSQQGC